MKRLLTILFIAVMTAATYHHRASFGLCTPVTISNVSYDGWPGEIKTKEQVFQHIFEGMYEDRPVRISARFDGPSLTTLLVNNEPVSLQVWQRFEEQIRYGSIVFVPWRPSQSKNLQSEHRAEFTLSAKQNTPTYY